MREDPQFRGQLNVLSEAHKSPPKTSSSSFFFFFLFFILIPFILKLFSLNLEIFIPNRDSIRNNYK